MRERTHSLLLLTLVSLAQVIAYLVKYENYSLKDAVDRVRERCASLAITIVFVVFSFGAHAHGRTSRRPIVYPHKLYVEQLRELEPVWRSGESTFSKEIEEECFPTIVWNV